jgi:lipopolysaccharide/colanic/teichoic acid biosynthesis glycosyltransferase
MMYPFLKRLLDITAASFGLLFLCPLLMLIWMLVRLFMGGPVLFQQERAGLGGKPFFVYKFRTMNSAVDPSGRLLPDANRLTPLGRFLRKTSLDELPQLFNVLKGEMALVGPRPLYIRYISRYSEEQKKRLLVRPGITGLAQISGRNAISWETRFALDVDYVNRASLGLDITILLKTIVRVLRPEGISQDGRATMDEFMGPPQPNGPQP